MKNEKINRSNKKKGTITSLNAKSNAITKKSNFRAIKAPIVAKFLLKGNNTLPIKSPKTIDSSSKDLKFKKSPQKERTKKSISIIKNTITKEKEKNIEEDLEDNVKYEQIISIKKRKRNKLL